MHPIAVASTRFDETEVGQLVELLFSVEHGRIVDRSRNSRVEGRAVDDGYRAEQGSGGAVQLVVAQRERGLDGQIARNEQAKSVLGGAHPDQEVSGRGCGAARYSMTGDAQGERDVLAQPSQLRQVAEGPL